MFDVSGSETIDSTSSHEDYSTIPLCTESDCDEIYRTARKGRQVGRGVSLKQNFQKRKNLNFPLGIWYCLVIFDNNWTNDCC